MSNFTQALNMSLHVSMTFGLIVLLISQLGGSFFPLLGRITGGATSIKISAGDSDVILSNCREFYELYFSPDYDYMKKFQGLFPETRDKDTRYRKLKYLCGGLLSIEGAIKSEGNLQTTVQDVNDALGTDLTTAQIEEMLESEEAMQVGDGGGLAEERRGVWLAELETELQRQINGVVH